MSEAQTLERAVSESPAVKRTSINRAWLKDRLDRGRTKVFTEKVKITPDLALIMLEANTQNRGIRPAKLSQFKSDMNSGRWQFNGETIKFAKTGELNDGQHRLQSVVETSRPQEMLVCFGLERASRLTVDTGANRTAGDHLAVSGWPYATTMAAVARMTIGYERMDKEALGRPGDISASEVTQRVSDDPLIQEAGAYAATHSSKFKQLARTSIIGFAFYQFAKLKPREAKTFIEKLRTGADLSEESPIRLLREKLLNSPRLPVTGKVELIIRAWNAWIKNAPIKQLRFTGKLPQVEG